MKNVLNYILVLFKFTLYLISLGLTFFIILSMYDRIGKNILESYHIFLPFIVLVVCYIINILLDQKNVKNSVFYNMTCCLVFLDICLVCCRAIFDKNMLLNEIMGYNINFAYFSDFIPFMKIMIYGLSIVNVCLMFKGKEEIQEDVEKPIARKIEVL